MNDRKLTTGFYRPTDSFRSISEHVAVCFEDDLTLVAIVGASDDDTDHVLESHQYAQLFAAAPETLKKLSNALARNAELETSNKRLQGFYDDVEVDNLRKSERIVTLKETVNRQALMIYAKDRQIAELTRMLFALGKQDGQTIRALKQELETIKSCKHMNVKIHSRLYRPSTREEPAEFEYKAECKDCGELFSADDVDEWAEVEE